MKAWFTQSGKKPKAAEVFAEDKEHIAGGNVNGSASLGKQFVSSLK